ncbi:MAG TPA: aspartate kinase [Candidatus Amulumruptor caecigallinarius]|uniref:Aspartokinase n=1 Tax=Candidatus Amulumruptor caecigallinarius TaxID=2109911 RepID=A0A921E7L0_9BACT|nr:aspartate kinase [Candidatus Amulumruptor caecigallinarius]
MIVLKFGGTSVGTSSALEQVKNIVMAHQEPVIVVVSALGGMTDQLVELMQMDSRSSKVTEMLDAFGCRYANLISAMIDESIQPQVRTDINRLLRELQKDIGNAPRDTYFQDKIISYGERLSSVFVSRLFGAKNAVLVPVLDLVSTLADNRSLDRDISFSRINDYFRNNDADIYIVPGFIASAPDGHITNLGRGGSDLTAAIIARALNVSKIEIWTDVDGYMTADPRRDSNAAQIPQLTYDAALDMSLNGAKVVYAPALEIMKDVRIPLEVKNTFNPDGRFTSIR